MRILQLTSDWKWTGPAEPMLRLALAQRSQGHAVWLACPPAPAEGGRSVGDEASRAGLVPGLGLARGRGVRLLGDRRDVRALTALIARERVDVVHCWHTRDHVLAVRADFNLETKEKLQEVLLALNDSNGAEIKAALGMDKLVKASHGDHMTKLQNAQELVGTEYLVPPEPEPAPAQAPKGLDEPPKKDTKN